MDRRQSHAGQLEEDVAQVRPANPHVAHHVRGAVQYRQHLGGVGAARQDDVHGIALDVRRLDVFPTLNFGIADTWSLVLFAGENPISYNYVNEKWFVPIDAMLIKRLSKTVELGVGSAYGVVRDNPTYKYQVYGRLSYYF